MRRTAAIIGALSLVVTLAPSVPWAVADELDAKQAEAARLEAALEKQGQRLSLADEAYNEAAAERQRIDTELSRTRDEVAAAEARWNELKGQLGQRARALYKNPGAWLESLLGTRSMDELTRGRVLAGSVMKQDTDLLFATDRARREMERQAESLHGLRAVAKETEEELAGRREAVVSELEAQRTLLADVEGEIDDLLAERRQREIEEAERRAREVAEAQAAAEALAAAESARGAATSAEPPSREAGEAAETEVEAPAEPVRAPRPSAAKAVQTARAQLGKPYRWAAEGPDAYDCSGLTKYAWASAGVSLPHSSRAQFRSLPKVSMDEVQPGDLLFYGSPIHHVGIYEGDGIMINAPYTGENVRRNSIYRDDFAGAARP